jgi:hypothetical protein
MHEQPEQSNDVAHVLVSRKLRSKIVIKSAYKLDQQTVQNALSTSSETNLFILDFTTSETDKCYKHEVEFIQIPNSYITEIKKYNYNYAIFYVTPSENSSNISIISGPATMDMVQTTDYDGNVREFMSKKICI